MDAGASELTKPSAPAFSLADPVEAALGTMATYGPRAVTPDMPLAAVQEIARSPQFAVLKGGFAEAIPAARGSGAEALHRHRTTSPAEEIQSLGRPGRHPAYAGGAGSFRANAVRFRGTETWSDRGAAWADQEYIEWYRAKFPYCQVKTTHGTRGQEYAGNNKVR
jgi:hypothetical protein